ncbi:MAG TPA: PD-(D/E)XK nuclease family protein [Syntrophobacter fumaroxidans]|nr:PD-(D/E)XK nuclease family protein [Syntrophobacter fumaroxidans]
MNIFRTLASGKHKFREEYVSAFLGYLLCPKMDHGLGSTFLTMLLNEIGSKTNSEAIRNLAGQFAGKIWENILQNEGKQPLVEIEFSYPTPNNSQGFIDIVLRCDNWFVMIENKINFDAKKKNQLKEQYNGLRKVLSNQKFNDARVLAIYVVPAIPYSDEWVVYQTFFDEANFKLKDGDAICIVSWQPTRDQDGLSIVEIIRDLLAKEARGEIAPIGYEIRHTLLSLIDFALGEFHGFPYDDTAVSKPKTDSVKVFDVLNMQGDLYVGIKFGIKGIIDKGWRNGAFLDERVKVTDNSNMGWQYVPLRDFQIIAKWSMDPENESLEGMNWEAKSLGTENFFRITKLGGSEIYIGLKGGLQALQAMNVAAIKTKTWGVGNTKKTPQWFSGENFCDILEKKGIQYDLIKSAADSVQHLSKQFISSTSALPSSKM